MRDRLGHAALCVVQQAEHRVRRRGPRITLDDGGKFTGRFREALLCQEHLAEESVRLDR